MYVPKLVDLDLSNVNGKYEQKEMADHIELAQRLRKTLYYGKQPTTDRPSLPVTEIAVEFFQEAAPRELGRLDTYYAASASRKACMSPCSMMLGMIYIERLKHRNPDYLQKISSSDVFLLSMMIASKYLYDEGVDEEVFNDEWAESANIDLEDLNELEREFLSAMDWHLFVKEVEFNSMLAVVENRIALSQGIDRGWFSYTDLWVLLQCEERMEAALLTAQQMMRIIIVCSVAYAMSVMVMVGSSLIAAHVMTRLTTVPTHTPAASSVPMVDTNDTTHIAAEFGLDDTASLPMESDLVFTKETATEKEPSKSGTLLGLQLTQLGAFWTALVSSYNGPVTEAGTCKQCQQRNREMNKEQVNKTWTGTGLFVDNHDNSGETVPSHQCLMHRKGYTDWAILGSESVSSFLPKQPPESLVLNPLTDVVLGFATSVYPISVPG